MLLEQLTQAQLVGSVVDIGGGAGVLLSAILGRTPNARGVLFDLDHVAQAARSAVEPQIAARCEFTGGDFFKAVPSGEMSTC